MGGWVEYLRIRIRAERNRIINYRTGFPSAPAPIRLIIPTFVKSSSVCGQRIVVRVNILVVSSSLRLFSLIQKCTFTYGITQNPPWQRRLLLLRYRAFAPCLRGPTSGHHLVWSLWIYIVFLFYWYILLSMLMDFWLLLLFSKLLVYIYL